MRGQLFCDFCCPTAQRIALGEVKEETDKFNGVEVTTPGYTVTISTMLRDVLTIDQHCVATLSCGHKKTAMPLASLQEWVMTDDGQIVRGVGLAEFR
jgi:hypothetical protein